MAIEQLIAIARKTFGFKWSKDLWLLRDFDLVAIPISVPELFYQSSFIKWIYPKAYHTSNFSRLLRFIYLPNQLENCDQLTQHLRGRALMFDVDGKPNQILQLLAIDLILNPERWSQYHIVSNPRYFGGAFQEVLKIAHYLNQHGVFNKDDMKLNIIRFNTYLKNETPIVIREGNLAASKAWQAPKMPLHDSGLASAKAITENKASKYQAHRDNKIVFLGFMLPKQIEASKPGNNSASAFDWLARSTFLRRV